jgi:mRNA interferase RelE/StbE
MWNVEYSKRFLKELANLPDKVRTRVEVIVFQELKTENPFALGYLEKMTGYTDKYKIRVGEYRVGVSIDTKSKTIMCQRVANRKDIYKVFP